MVQVRSMRSQEAGDLKTFGKKWIEVNCYNLSIKKNKYYYLIEFLGAIEVYVSVCYSTYLV